jgi:hypothetical protein
MEIRKISYYMCMCSPSYERSKSISGLDLFTKMLLPRAEWLGPALARLTSFSKREVGRRRWRRSIAV